MCLMNRELSGKRSPSRLHYDCGMNAFADADFRALNGSIVHTMWVALLLAMAVFGAALWRRVAGVVALLPSVLLSVVLYLEFRDPAMAGGIEIAYGTQLLLRLKFLPVCVAGSAAASFWLGEGVRTRRTKNVVPPGGRRLGST